MESSNGVEEGRETRVIISHGPSGGVGESCRNLKLEGSLLRLRHPKTGKPTSYGFFGGSLQEFHWFKECYGSWFLGNYVCEAGIIGGIDNPTIMTPFALWACHQSSEYVCSALSSCCHLIRALVLPSPSDGGFYTSTPVDPVFLMLPIFEEARMKKGKDSGKFRDLDEILLVDGYPGYGYLTVIAETSMAVVCEVKEFEASKFYRLNDTMVLSWLCHKVEQIKRALQSMDKNYTSQDEKSTLIDAISLLGEYMNEEPWLKLICDHLGLDVQEATRKAPLSETHISNGENSPNSFQPTPVNNGSGKSGLTTRKQSKRLKPETSSHNIKDMFRKASK